MAKKRASGKKADHATNLDFEAKLWLAADTQTFVLLAGPEDITDLDRVSKSGRRLKNRICAKTVCRGDRLLIYIWRPEHKIAATAVADCDAWYDDESGRYLTTLRDVHWLENPITLEEMREGLPNWRWTVNCASRCRVPAKVAKALWKLSKRPTDPPINRQKKHSSKSKSSSRKGAGFGRAESNRIVEQAAVNLVTEEFVRQGYTVTSRESEHIGYDLDVTQKKDRLHVEVKGVSGCLPEFIITANEVKQSKSDRAFRVCVVTEATSDKPTIHSFTGKELNAMYQLKAVTYRARLKRK
jgi:hypothetical protein